VRQLYTQVGLQS